MACGISWCQSSVVFEEIAKVAVILFTNRSLQTDWLLAHFNDLAYLLRSDLHLRCDLFRRGFTSKILQQATTDADEAVDRFDHMHRDTNRTRLIGDSPCDGLTDPPGGI